MPNHLSKSGASCARAGRPGISREKTTTTDRCTTTLIAHPRRIVPRPGADGTTYADLTSAFENGRQQDIHDPNPADEKRDGSNGHHNRVEKLLGTFLLCEQLGGDDDVEVARAVMRGVQNATDH